MSPQPWHTRIIIEDYTIYPGSGEKSITVTEDLIERLAREVWQGKWGNNAERRRRLGPIYEIVQNRADEMMRQ